MTKQPSPLARQIADQLYKDPADTIWLSYGSFADWCDSAINVATADHKAQIERLQAEFDTGCKIIAEKDRRIAQLQADLAMENEHAIALASEYKAALESLAKAKCS